MKSSDFGPLLRAARGVGNERIPQHKLADMVQKEMGENFNYSLFNQGLISSWESKGLLPSPESMRTHVTVAAKLLGDGKLQHFVTAFNNGELETSSASRLDYGYNAAVELLEFLLQHKIATPVLQEVVNVAKKHHGKVSVVRLLQQIAKLKKAGVAIDTFKAIEALLELES